MNAFLGEKREKISRESFHQLKWMFLGVGSLVIGFQWAFLLEIILVLPKSFLIDKTVLKVISNKNFIISEVAIVCENSRIQFAMIVLVFFVSLEHAYSIRRNSRFPFTIESDVPCNLIRVRAKRYKSEFLMHLLSRQRFMNETWAFSFCLALSSFYQMTLDTLCNWSCLLKP